MATFLFKLLFPFLCFSLFLQFIYWCYGKYLLKKGYSYIGHWYLAISLFEPDEVYNLCPYSDGDKCFCWSCSHYSSCSKRQR